MISRHKGFAKFQRKLSGVNEEHFDHEPFPSSVTNLDKFKDLCETVFRVGVDGNLSERYSGILDKAFSWHSHKADEKWGRFYSNLLVTEEIWMYCKNWHFMMLNGTEPAVSSEEGLDWGIDDDF